MLTGVSHTQPDYTGGRQGGTSNPLKNSTRAPSQMSERKYMCRVGLYEGFNAFCRIAKSLRQSFHRTPDCAPVPLADRGTPLRTRRRYHRETL